MTDDDHHGGAHPLRVRPEQVEELLTARQAMLADFRADRDGFLDAETSEVPEDLA